jgi:hypothetical protein
MTCAYSESTEACRRGTSTTHFPISRRAGGEATLAVGIDCHDLKDRFPLNAWPSATTTEARLCLAKALSLSHDWRGRESVRARRDPSARTDVPQRPRLDSNQRPAD